MRIRFSRHGSRPGYRGRGDGGAPSFAFGLEHRTVAQVAASPRRLENGVEAAPPLTRGPTARPRAGGRPRATLISTVTAVAIALLFLLLVPSVTLASPGVAEGSTSSFPTPIQHVFVIMLENAILSTVLAQGPYLTSLYHQYASADHYYGVCHPSASNYLALTSGRLLQCGSDAVTTYSDPNLADLVTSAGESWVAYMQSMPAPCTTANSGQYVAHHDPFIYYQDIVTNPSLCDSHVVPLTQFNASATPANLVWISPDRFHDGHTPQSVPNADAWLQSFLPPLLNEPWASSTVFFVLYDEGDFPNGTEDFSGYNGLNGGNAYFAAVSPYSRGQGLYTADASHYNLLATVEWLLGTANLGQNDASTQYPVMKSLFDFAIPPPTRYLVSGTVQATNGSGISGVRVFANSTGMSSSTSTNQTGEFAFSLPNGTYAVSTFASGWKAAEANVAVAGAGVLGLTLTVSPIVQSWPVTFTESGLPALATWTVRVDGKILTSTNSSAATNLPNGSFAFSASGPANYSASPTNGTVDVQGRGTTIPIAFHHQPPPTTVYPVTFTPAGLPMTATWGVRLGTDSVNGRGTLGVNESNGTYSYSISPPANYTANPASGAVTVSGAATFLTVPFTPVSPNGSGPPPPGSPTVYSIEFIQQGLSPGVRWWVALSGNQSLNVSSLGPTIFLNLTNGSYTFAIGSPSNLAPNVSRGSFDLPGAPPVHRISFSALAPPAGLPSPGFLPPSASALAGLSPLSIAVLAIAASALAATVDRLFHHARRLRNEKDPPRPVRRNDPGRRRR